MMTVLSRFSIITVLVAVGFLAACTGPANVLSMKGDAYSSTQTITVTGYDPPLPFITVSKPYSVLECSYSVLSQDSDYWAFGWILTVVNKTSSQVSLNATIQLLYDTGYQIAAYKIPQTIQLAPEAQQTFNGRLDLKTEDARQVKSITAFIQTD